MIKKIIIIVIIIVICGAGIFLWLWLSRNNGVPSSTSVTASSTLPGPGTLPAGVIPADAVGDTIALGTAQGTVMVKNFYKTVVGTDEEYIIFQKSSGYEFLYDTQDGSFVVSINEGPLSQVQPAAEAAFLQALSIGETDACNKLTVVVGVDSSVDASLAGKALHLSFCSSGAFGQ